MIQKYRTCGVKSLRGEKRCDMDALLLLTNEDTEAAAPLCLSPLDIPGPTAAFGQFNCWAQRAVTSSCLSEDWTVMVFPARSAKDQSYGTPALQDCSRATSIMESLNAASPPPGWGTSAKEKQRTGNCNGLVHTGAPHLMQTALPGRWGADSHTVSSELETPMLGFVQHLQ